MKIVTCIRTYNEEFNIRQCCEAYQFTDAILIADGGSTDKTKEIASTYPKVSVRDYEVKVKCQGGIERNPDGPHLQFLYDWALEEGADWIISQDCDQRPNYALKRDARGIFEESDRDFILVTQLFLWGNDHYFPELSGADRGWPMQGLWAWRANINMKVIDHMPHFEFSYDGKTAIDLDRSPRSQRLLPPYCFMHFGWPTPERVIQHVDYYRKSGLISGMIHPLMAGGNLADLPEWAHE